MSLKAKQYGSEIKVSGEIIWGDVAAGKDKLYWITFWLYERPDHTWRVGPYDSPRWESVNRFLTVVRKYGQPYQASRTVKLEIFKEVDWIYGHMTKDAILSSEIQTLRTTINYGPMAPITKRRSVSMDNNEIKSEKTPKANFGRCQVVPRETAKEKSGQCPRTVNVQNEYGACSGHLSFIKRGSETRLMDGRTINPRTVEQPKTTPEVQAVPEVQPGAPEPVPPKKLSKKAKVQQALETLRQKDAEKAAAVPVEMLAPVDPASTAIGTLNRTLKP